MRSKLASGRRGSSGAPSLIETLSSRSRSTRRPSRSSAALVDILRQHPALGPHPFAEAHGIIALARADVGNGGACGDLRQVHHHFGLVDLVALRLGGELVGCWRWKPGDRRCGKSREVAARSESASLGLCSRPAPARRDRTAPRQTQSTSSTVTFSPVTRCASAAAMNGSSAPSSTSSGAVEVAPVRRSLTSW